MNYRELITTFFIFFLIRFTIYSQPKAVNRDKYRIHITYTEEKIVIDGLLNENIWQIAEKVNHFQRVTPTDTGYAIAQTEVMVGYDESNLYVGAICYDPTPGKRPIQSLRRDFTFMGNDNFACFSTLIMIKPMVLAFTCLLPEHNTIILDMMVTSSTSHGIQSGNRLLKATTTAG